MTRAAGNVAIYNVVPKKTKFVCLLQHNMATTFIIFLPLFSFFQVLQKQMDLELELFGDLKQQEKTLISAAANGSGNGGGGSGGPGGPANNTSNSSIGKVFMLSLSSQPVRSSLS